MNFISIPLSIFKIFLLYKILASLIVTPPGKG